MLTVIIISLVASVLCFIPLMVSTADVKEDYDILRRSVVSDVYMKACLATLAASIPMVLDALLDMNLPKKVSLPRWLLLSSLVLPNLILYVNSHQYSLDPILLFNSAVHAREIMFMGGLLSYYVGDHRTPRKAAAIISIMIVYCITNIEHTMYVWRQHPIVIRVTSMVFSSAALVSIMIICAYRTRNWALRRTETEPYSVVYVACLAIDLVAKWIVFLAMGAKQWDTRHGTYFAILTLIDCAVAVVASTLPGRMARDEATCVKNMLEMKRNFVRYISHEIRTPLNTVYMGIQLATSKLSQLQGVQHILDILSDIQDSCNVSIEILNDLLMFDKLENGGMKLDLQYITYRDLLERTVHPFVVQARQSEIDFYFSGDTYFSPELKDVVVQVDVNKISQVIRNLVSNALKFTPKGGCVTVHSRRVTRDERPVSTTTASTSLQSATPKNNSENSSTGLLMTTPKYKRNSVGTTMKSEFVRLEVRDTGPGISKENQKRLFREIVQFNAADLQNGKGSGLGLWISRAIVDLHEGIIGVESEGVPGEGCMFYVEIGIPQTPPSAGAPTVQTNGNNGGSIYGTAAGDSINDSLARSEDTARSIDDDLTSDIRVSEMHLRRVMIVDDSAFNRKMMKKVMESNCDHIMEAADGVDAVQQVEEAMRNNIVIDVIFMDSIMPRMGGVDATKQIRQALEYLGVIIGVTGNVGPDDIAAFLESGANRVLAKPLQLSQVKIALRELSVGAPSKSLDMSETGDL